MKITDIEPKKVFKFFEEISKIPHGSRNTDKITDYCLNFAAERELEAFKDQGGNVIIFANGTDGYENSEPVILQGHLDMVCEKDPHCTIDMETEGLDLCTDGEYIWAKNTTLGADNGIAIAYILALLDSTNIPHPPIEAVLTNNEEIGMLGAENLDVSKLKGKRLINIDSEEEGTLIVSCAGGVRSFCELPLNFVDTDDNLGAFQIEIEGLLGGHSGVDIDKHRKNANVLLGRLYQHIDKIIPFSIGTIDGGKKTNVIPSGATTIICIAKENKDKLIASIKKFQDIIYGEVIHSEPDFTITVTPAPIPPRSTDADSTKKLIFTLLQAPDGIQTMSPDIPNMVQSSLNLGELTIKDNHLKMGYLIRSNAATGKQFIIQKLTSFVEYLDGNIIFTADYPAWEYRANSPLRLIMEEAFEEVYSDRPHIAAIHAGLECGILAEKIADADIVSFGPNLDNVHTTKERMEIDSAVRCWNYLLKVLEKCK